MIVSYQFKSNDYFKQSRLESQCVFEFRRLQDAKYCILILGGHVFNLFVHTYKTYTLNYMVILRQDLVKIYVEIKVV